MLVVAPLLAGPAVAQVPDAPIWRAVGELAFTDVSGNRALSLLSSKITVTRTDPKRIQLSASAGLRYGRAEGELAVADYSGSLEAKLRPLRSISPFVSLAANRDDIRALAIRAAISMGADFNIVSDSSVQLAVGLALLQDYEAIGRTLENPNPARRSLTRFNLRTRAGFPLRQGVMLRHQSMLQPVIQHFDDYLLTTETGVAVLLSERLALQTSFTFNRDATPPEGILFKNDRTLTVGLIVTL